MRRFWLCLLLALSCAKPKPSAAYFSAIEAANKASRARDHAAEAAAWKQASESCLPEDCPRALLNYAKALLENKETENAKPIFTTLIAQYPKTQNSTAAYVELARLAQNAGDLAEATRLSKEAIAQEQESAACFRAVEMFLQISASQGGDSAMLAAIEELRAMLDPTQELSMSLLYRHAELLDTLGRSTEALAEDKQVFEAGIKYRRFDDAAWRLAQRYIALQKPSEAEKVLETLLETRKTSWLMGSSFSVFLDDAQLLYADLARDRGDNQEAQKRYTFLVEKFRRSILRDDALFRLITLEAAPKKDRCDALELLKKDHADSRHIKKLAPYQEKLGC